MSATSEISAAAAAFLEEKMPATVGTVRRDGTAKLTTAWYEYRDGEFWLNSYRGSDWLNHIERDGKAELLFVDPTNMWRTVRVSATLIETTDEGGDDHIDRLSLRYLGTEYPRKGLNQRVIIRLQPVDVRSNVDQS